VGSSGVLRVVPASPLVTGQPMAPPDLATLREAIPTVFHAFCLGALALYVLVYAAPRFMVRLHSVPWAFHAGRNLDLRFQGVLYAAFHTSRWARLTHLTLASDQVAWTVLAWLIHPLVAALVVAVPLAQAVLLRDRALVTSVAVAWTFVVLAAASVLVFVAIDDALVLAQATLVLGAFARTAGHVTEPIPPGLLDATDRFHPMRRARATAGVVLGPVVGTVSEFAAGLPFRLFVVLVFQTASRLGFRGSHGSHTDHVDEARRIHANGWRASTTTAWMTFERAAESGTHGS